ncbi:MAG TPA: anthranilate phosphoribosyltransferase [Nevskiales bacterium]|nr:anthranilate phosphoribosyltransferase [Nevskiales bacterium]
MSVQQALAKLMERRDLDAGEMQAAMRQIMGGEATPAQIAGFLVALRMKGETPAEIAAAAGVMRELSLHVAVDDLREQLVDTCGTGGDAAGLFNVSTAAAIVVAAAGGRVAKHGNRAASGKTGSADVLEAAGVKLDLGPKGVERCIRELGIGFMLAPRFHAAMKHAVGPRREMGVRTLFNVIGPLTNPAGARNQVLGVFHPDWLLPMAEVLKRLGSRHVLVVHGEDGLDEISIAARTQVVELKNGEIRHWHMAPEDVDLPRAPLDGLRVSSAQESLALIRRVLAGEPGPAADTVAFNAGAALYVGGQARTVKAGVELARAAIASGAAARKLEDFARLSQSLGDE